MTTPSRSGVRRTTRRPALEFRGCSTTRTWPGPLWITCPQTPPTTTTPWLAGRQRACDSSPRSRPRRRPRPSRGPRRPQRRRLDPLPALVRSRRADPARRGGRRPAGRRGRRRRRPRPTGPSPLSPRPRGTAPVGPARPDRRPGRAGRRGRPAARPRRVGRRRPEPSTSCATPRPAVAATSRDRPAHERHVAADHHDHLGRRQRNARGQGRQRPRQHRLLACPLHPGPRGDPLRTDADHGCDVVRQAGQDPVEQQRDLVRPEAPGRSAGQDDDVVSRGHPPDPAVPPLAWASRPSPALRRPPPPARRSASCPCPAKRRVSSLPSAPTCTWGASGSPRRPDGPSRWTTPRPAR